MDEVLAYSVGYVALAITDAIAEVRKLAQYGLSCRPIEDRRANQEKNPTLISQRWALNY